MSDASCGMLLPSSAAEALNDPNWKEAMDREYQSLMDNNVWSLVAKPEGRSVIGSKWHFAYKMDAQGNIVKYKARFVARGFTQLAGIDYNETFSPTARISTLRLALALGVSMGIQFHQMDIKTAFLNAPIDEVIYIQQPEGYEQGNGLVCLLAKSLYGLKQSGKNWYKRLMRRLKALGFISSVHDICLLFKRDGEHLGCVGR